MKKQKSKDIQQLEQSFNSPIVTAQTQVPVRRIQNAYNYVNDPLISHEHPRGPSITVPNEAYSIEELFRRHASGTAPDILRDPIYTDVEDFDTPDFEKVGKMDPVDQTAVLQHIKQKQADRQEIIDKKSAEYNASQEAKKQAAEEELFERMRKKREAEGTEPQKPGEGGTK